MEHLRKDRCFVIDRRQKNAAQMSAGKAPTMPSSPTQQTCGNKRSAAPKGQLEMYNTEKEDVAALMDSHFNVCTVVGLRWLYAKMIKAFSRNSNWSCQGKCHWSFRTKTFFSWDHQNSLCCRVRPSVMTNHTAGFVQTCGTMTRLV